LVLLRRVAMQEFQLKMEGLKQRREELENKELDLRRSLEKFNTFLTVFPQRSGVLHYDSKK